MMIRPKASCRRAINGSASRRSSVSAISPRRASGWRKLGYGPSKPFVTKILISRRGSGQMQPLAMNELRSAELAEAGMKIDFEVVEWNTMINIWRAGAKHEARAAPRG